MMLVVDRSGSMNGLDKIVSDGIELNVAQAIAAGKTNVSICRFDHSIDFPYWEKVAANVGRVDFKPRGSTAMLDAVGRTLDAVQTSDKKYDTYLMVIISDGYENASTKESYESIQKRILDLTGTGIWTFSYVGSNQNLADISRRLAIPIRNTQSWRSDPIGTQIMAAASASSAGEYFAARGDGLTASSSYNSEKNETPTGDNN
jgi:uncharacterized protein with von Willebrand factor type A (vWA) domain